LRRIAQAFAGPADPKVMSIISGISSSYSLPGAAASAVAAIGTGSQQLAQAASQIADPATANVAAALLGSSQALLISQVGAAVAATSNAMMGILLDVTA
jgi:hypothetical protein